MNRLLLALVIVLCFSCNKDKDNDSNTAPTANYTCMVWDSSVYRNRTCANSFAYDTLNEFGIPAHYPVYTYTDKTQQFINNLVAAFPIRDTQVAYMDWLFCGSGASYASPYDTIYEFQKLVCSH